MPLPIFLEDRGRWWSGAVPGSPPPSSYPPGWTYLLRPAVLSLLQTSGGDRRRSALTNSVKRADTRVKAGGTNKQKERKRRWGHLGEKQRPTHVQPPWRKELLWAFFQPSHVLMSDQQAVHWKGRSCKKDDWQLTGVGGERSSFPTRTQRVCAGNMQHTAKDKNSCKHKAAGWRPIFSEAACELNEKIDDFSAAAPRLAYLSGWEQRRRRRSQSEQG